MCTRKDCLDVLNIYKLLIRGLSDEVISKESGRSVSNICRLRNGEAWHYSFKEIFGTVPVTSAADHKISKDEVTEVLRLCLNTTVSPKEISIITTIDVSTIRKIRKRERWQKAIKEYEHGKSTEELLRDLEDLIKETENMDDETWLKLYNQK